MNKGVGSHSVLCTNGRVQLRRHRYGTGSQLSECPIDRLVDATEAVVSIGVRQFCCREGTNARSFSRGRENLAEIGKIQAGEELFRQIVESEGKAVIKASNTEQLELEWAAVDCKTKTPDGQETSRMYASADGVLVPTVTQQEKDRHRETVKKKREQMPKEKRDLLRPLGRIPTGCDQRYKQIYVTCFYDQDHQHRLVGVTADKVEGLRKLLRQEAGRVRLRGAKERVGLIDGAVCLKNNLEVLPLELVVLDFYHASEHVADAAKNTGADKSWLDETLHLLRHDGYDKFYERLLDWRSTLRGNKRKAADDLIHYISARTEMIVYDQCDQRGLDVGSGPIESMCGVTTDRIKGRGRRWNLENAESVMALEALYQSTGLWDQYWRKALANNN